MNATRSRTIARPRLGPAHPVVSGALRWVWRAISLHRQRRALARLDDHTLRDIGLTSQDVRDEANRPFWNAPAHWRR